MKRRSIFAARFIKELVSLYLGKRVSRSAAELSFFLTMSVFPMLICLNGMLGSAFPTDESFLEFAEGLIPQGTILVLSEYMGYISTHAGRPMLTAGILLMLTTAAAAFRSIHNIMADMQGKPRFKGLFGLLISFLFSLVFLLVMYFAVVVVFAGNWFLTFLSEHLGFEVSGIWTWLRFILLFVILLVIIYGLYRITAPKGAEHKLLAGAVVAAMALVAVSIFFSWMIGMSVRYPLVYGSLASVIILMVWLYLCGNILIMGNGVNIVLRMMKTRGHD